MRTTSLSLTHSLAHSLSRSHSLALNLRPLSVAQWHRTTVQRSFLPIFVRDAHARHMSTRRVCVHECRCALRLCCVVGLLFAHLGRLPSTSAHEVRPRSWRVSIYSTGPAPFHVPTTVVRSGKKGIPGLYCALWPRLPHRGLLVG